MCNELEQAIEMQEQLGTDTTKGAMMLMKAAAKSITKLSAQLKEHIVKDEQNTAQIIAELQSLRESLQQYQQDATKWQVIVMLCQRLFGNTRRCIITLVYISIVFGLANFSDIVEMLKALA